jgi:chemotaxis protein MotB
VAATNDQEQRPAPPNRGDDGAEAGSEIPEWIVTFADMMSLLLCFFILLLSFAKTDIAKFQVTMGSIREAFGVQRERQQDVQAAFSPAPEKRALDESDLVKAEKELLEVARMLKEMINERAPIAQNAIVSAEDGGVTLRVNSRVLFAEGTAELSPAGVEICRMVHGLLLKHKYDLIVEGHTGSREPLGSAYPTYWELSSARAVTLLRGILELGLNPRRVKAVGYADTRPLVPEETDTRALNRRVEFFFRPYTSIGKR